MLRERNQVLVRATVVAYTDIATAAVATGTATIPRCRGAPAAADRLSLMRRAGTPLTRPSARVSALPEPRRQRGSEPR